MLQKYKAKREEGFTIIEVLIVLAIAGLIILIVFLAVPALQRNSRNTQRRNDVTALLGAIQEFQNNNNGQLPDTAAEYTTVRDSSNPGFYANNTTEIDLVTNATSAVANVTPAPNIVRIRNFAKCPTTVPATGAVTLNTGSPSTRSVVAVFQVETSGGVQNQCEDL